MSGPIGWVDRDGHFVCQACVYAHHLSLPGAVPGCMDPSHDAVYVGGFDCERCGRAIGDPLREAHRNASLAEATCARCLAKISPLALHECPDVMAEACIHPGCQAEPGEECRYSPELRKCFPCAPHDLRWALANARACEECRAARQS